MVLWPNGSTTPPNFSAEGHFGWRKSSAPGASRFHRGLDMWGLGTVHAIADGTVVAVGWGAGHGWGGGYQVWIQHDGFFTRSLHLVNGSALVRVGDQVVAGQAIGTEGMTGAFQVHLHLEITPGQWHAGNFGQVDPKAWLFERVNGSASASGGGITETPDITTESEEDDMRLIRINDSKSGRNGRHYAVAPEYIKQIKTAEAVKAIEDAFGITERPISEWTLTRVLGGYGIPSGVLNGKGYVLDDLNGQGKHVSGGTWSRAQKVERLAYLAGK